MKKTDFDDTSKHLNKRITLNEKKYLLVENEFEKLTDIWLKSGKSYFGNDEAQLY